MAAEEPQSYLHGLCHRMAENLLKDVAGLTDEGKGPDEDLVLQVVDVLQARIETVQEYLKAHVKTEGNVTNRKDSFHKMKENETAWLHRILNTKGSLHPETAPSWCECGNCRDMKRGDEKVCCGRETGDCLSQSNKLLVLLEGPRLFLSPFTDNFRLSDIARVNLTMT
ncbi:uncharacterized protein LOC125376998 [Haliotis rufescens]|uniref:uncharacterized protein LOC125376998 n=1 Tax=Haliotis rufescens TaxID=6454 RepID=UPI00201E77EA|nr:uncharacterized protein LOC125376998 [Haliotis rufescens]